jgi:palmitoyltransferase
MPEIYQEKFYFSLSLIGSLIAVLILTDLTKSNLTSPGYSTDLHQPEQIFQMCEKCSYFKPLRSHHCSICNKCILDMDHHCIWINNCVGLKNKAPFYRFILWCILAGLYLTLTLGKSFFQISIPSWDTIDLSPFSRGLIKFLFPLGLSVFVVVGTLMGFQSYLLLKNLTTLEYLSINKNNSLCSKVLRCLSRSKKSNN